MESFLSRDLPQLPTSFMRHCFRWLAALAALVLVSCATPDTDQADSTLCDFNLKRTDKQRVGHVIQSGQYVPGEISVKIYREWTTNVASAIARPKRDVYRREFRDDCFNKEGNYWYPCMKTAEADLSDIRGIARSQNLDQSEKIAVRLCERLTEKHAPRISGMAIETSDLACYVTVRKVCPLPEE